MNVPAASVKLPVLPLRYRNRYPVIAGLPVFTGAVQLTLRLVGVAGTLVTVGAAGAIGGSDASVTVMVNVCAALVRTRSPVPLVAVICTL